MFQVKGIVNSVFNSKTYILFHERYDSAWLVDVGDIEPILAFLGDNRKTVLGVFLTHAHFDHIYGLLSLLKHYPKCVVYATDYCKMALASDKLNMSRYYESSFEYEGDNVRTVYDGDEFLLFNDEPYMICHETPGHNPGCMTMICGNNIFTGDSYIPEVGANTQLPYANREQAQQSLNKIFKWSEGRIIFPGHKIC